MKQFEIPEIKIENFSVEDVVTTSSGCPTVTTDDEF